MDRYATSTHQHGLKARIILPSLGTLYFCQHCADTLPFPDDYYIAYETVEVTA